MAAAAMTTRLLLRDVVDAAYPAALLAELQALRGQAIDVDGSRVVRTSTLALQVLLSAAMTWKSEGLAFHVVEASSALADAFRTLGLSESQLQFDAVNP